MNHTQPISPTLARRLKQRRVRIVETLKMLAMAQTQAEKQAIGAYLNSL
jgi:hypothetical protein